MPPLSSIPRPGTAAARAASNNKDKTKSTKKRPSRTRSHKFRAQDFVRRRSNEKITDHYQLGKLLGDGQFGEVFAATSKGGTQQNNKGQQQQQRAIKKIQKLLLDKADHEEVFHEFSTLKEMDHPNILKMFEILEDPEDYWIVTELCPGGELLDELEENGPLTEVGAALVLKQVLSCVNYCHVQQKVVHRDLKLENILLQEVTKKQQQTKSTTASDTGAEKDSNTPNNNNNSTDSEQQQQQQVVSYNPLNIKVIDFGLSVHFQDPEEPLTSPVGSMLYIAPEVLDCNYNYKCDIWSCGVIAYILLCGYAPFEGYTDMEQRELITMGHVSFNCPIWQNNVSKQARDFVSYLMTYEPDKRPTAEQALQHPWIQQATKVHSEQFKQRKGGMDAALQCLENCRVFEASSKLKQATCAFMASQLALSKSSSSSKGDEAEADNDETGDKDDNDADKTQDKTTMLMIGEIFRAMDLDSDGRLSPKELILGFQDFLGPDAITTEEVEDIFTRIDLSSTGYIDYSEFVIAAIGLHDLGGTADNKATLLQEAFQRLLDHDGSGYISKEKLKQEMTPFYGDDVEDDVIDKIIRQADHDEDGQISWADFQAMMTKKAHFVPSEKPRQQSQSPQVDRTANDSAGTASTPPTATPAANSPKSVQDNVSFAAAPTIPSAPSTSSDITPTFTRKSRGSTGPKARLISAIFEKNLEKNREMGFTTFQYLPKEKSTQTASQLLQRPKGSTVQKKPLPRSKRVNFEELTKRATAKVDFDPNAAKLERQKEIEQMKASSGRAKERRATLTSMFSQEQEESKRRRESRLQELEHINRNNLSARGRRDLVEGAFKGAHLEKEQHLRNQRAQDLQQVRGSVTGDGGTKSRSLRLTQMFKPPESPKKRPSRFKSDDQVKKFRELQERQARLGELQSYDSSHHHQHGEALSNLFEDALNCNEEEVSEAVPEDAPVVNSTETSSQKDGSLTVPESAEDSRPQSDQEIRLGELEGLEEADSPDSAEMDASMTFHQAMFEPNDHPVPPGGVVRPDKTARLREPQNHGSYNQPEPQSTRIKPGVVRVASAHFDRMHASTVSFAEERRERLKELHGKDSKERTNTAAIEKCNSSTSKLDLMRESRLKEVQQIKAEKQGKTKSARNVFEQNIKANKEWQNSASSFNRSYTSNNSSFNKSFSKFGNGSFSKDEHLKGHQVRSKSLNPDAFRETQPDANKDERLKEHQVRSKSLNPDAFKETQPPADANKRRNSISFVCIGEEEQAAAPDDVAVEKEPLQEPESDRHATQDTPEDAVEPEPVDTVQIENQTSPAKESEDVPDENVLSSEEAEQEAAEVAPTFEHVDTTEDTTEEKAVESEEPDPDATKVVSTSENAIANEDIPDENAFQSEEPEPEPKAELVSTFDNSNEKESTPADIVNAEQDNFTPASPTQSGGHSNHSIGEAKPSDRVEEETDLAQSPPLPNQLDLDHVEATPSPTTDILDSRVAVDDTTPKGKLKTKQETTEREGFAKKSLSELMKLRDSVNMKLKKYSPKGQSQLKTKEESTKCDDDSSDSSESSDSSDGSSDSSDSSHSSESDESIGDLPVGSMSLSERHGDSRPTDKSDGRLMNASCPGVSVRRTFFVGGNPEEASGEKIKEQIEEPAPRRVSLGTVAAQNEPRDGSGSKNRSPKASKKSPTTKTQTRRASMPATAAKWEKSKPRKHEKGEKVDSKSKKEVSESAPDLKGMPCKDEEVKELDQSSRRKKKQVSKKLSDSSSSLRRSSRKKSNGKDRASIRGPAPFDWRKSISSESKDETVEAAKTEDFSLKPTNIPEDIQAFLDDINADSREKEATEKKDTDQRSKHAAGSKRLSKKLSDSSEQRRSSRKSSVASIGADFDWKKKGTAELPAKKNSKSNKEKEPNIVESVPGAAPVSRRSGESMEKDESLRELSIERPRGSSKLRHSSFSAYDNMRSSSKGDGGVAPLAPLLGSQMHASFSSAADFDWTKKAHGTTNSSANNFTRSISSGSKDRKKSLVTAKDGK